VTATGQSSGLSAQTTFLDSAASDCFRSVTSGNWSSTSTWETATAPACTTWTPATLVPSSAANTITIRSGHNVTVTVAATADQTTVDAGGTLTISSGQTLSIANGLGADLTVNGDIQISGTVTLAGSTNLNVNGTGTILSSGLLNGNGGSTSTRPFLTVNGTFTVDPGGAITTGGGGPMSHTVNATGVMNVNGPVTGTLQFTINAGGQVNATANITMGVPPMSAPSSLSIFGTLSASGTANVSAQRGDGNPVGAVNFGGLFSLADTATLSIGSVSTATFGVANGGTLVLGPTAFANGVGALSVGGGANLRIGSPDGINTSTTSGNVRTAGLDGYSTGVNYTYNGSTQNTGNALPTTVNNLTIASSGVVTLSTVPTVPNIQAITNTLTINSGATLREVGSFTLNIGTGGVSNSGTIQLHGGADACPEADTLLIRSTSPGTQRAWSGSGTFDIQDVNVRDQGGTAAIVAVSSTPPAPPPSANNGANWTIIGACTESVCGNGTVEGTEQCDAGVANGTTGSCCSLTCAFQAAATQCRAPADVCDAAEFCTGSSATCPADVLVAGGTTCRASAGVCDVPESCTGSSAACPADAKSTASCRASGGVCDVAESCDGSNNDCPPDVLVAGGTECRASAGACDLAESCDGSSAACPADARSTAECRPAADAVCDVAETCDGSSDNCPADAFAAPGTSCGDSDATACNAADSCDGAGTCVDRKKASGTVCLTGTGTCDPNDTCDGTTDACAPVYASPGTACGSSSDTDCTNPDTCNATGACQDNNAADGTSCDTGATCTINETCTAGVCGGGSFDPICTGCGPGNQPPVVTATTGPNPMPIGGSTNATVSATFTDAPGQMHTCSISWGDSSSSSGTVNETNGSGTCTGSHTYVSQPGPVVFTVTITITDNCGAMGSGVTYVVFYDPNGGFVTGGGWIDSPENACTYTPACTGVTGRANFGFVSKYKKGSTIPEGDTQLYFNAGNFKFDSDAYEWLVISGAKARYRGTGSVDGTAGFGFELTAWDGQQAGGGNVDRFRIKIWQGNSGNVVYDNERGSPDGSDPVTNLGGGSIVVHKK
jgi:hypothetical protein